MSQGREGSEEFPRDRRSRGGPSNATLDLGNRRRSRGVHSAWSSLLNEFKWSST